MISSVEWVTACEKRRPAELSPTARGYCAGAKEFENMREANVISYGAGSHFARRCRR